MVKLRSATAPGFGVVLMLVWRSTGHHGFFDRRTEVADPAILAREARP